MRFLTCCSLLAIPLLATALLPAGARADSAPFGYSYGSETLPKGAWEFETWSTWRTSKNEGRYNALDLRQEIEYGVTDRFQAALYLNERYHGIEGVGSPPDRDQFAFQGVAGEFRYQILNVFKDPLGFTLYAEPSYSRISKGSGKQQDEWEIELKGLFQKNFLDDQLITVLNLTPSYEVGKKKGDRHWEKEFGFEVTTGVSYRVAPRWYLGVETRYSSKYEDFPAEFNHPSWAFFVGPNVHYAADRWWATLTALPQVGGGPNNGDRSAALNLDDYERFELRLRTGFNF
jgi:opacity protein-like surface antigen